MFKRSHILPRFIVLAALVAAAPACSAKTQTTPSDETPVVSGSTMPAGSGSTMPAGSGSTMPAGSACDPTHEPNREYKLKDPSACKAALFQCPAGKKPFFNSCGCGCE
jgi:hypothetical protein